MIPLEMPPNLWTEAGDLGCFLRRKGVTSKTFDLLIAVYALSHSADLLTADRDFVAMSRAGVPFACVRHGKAGAVTRLFARASAVVAVPALVGACVHGALRFADNLLRSGSFGSHFSSM